MSFWYKIWNTFWGRTVPTVEIFSLYERKSSELRPVHSPEHGVEVYVSNWRFHANNILLLIMSFIIINQEVFQTYLSIHNINTRNKHPIFKDQKSIYLVFKKRYILCWLQNFQQLRCDIS